MGFFGGSSDKKAEELVGSYKGIWANMAGKTTPGRCDILAQNLDAAAEKIVLTEILPTKQSPEVKQKALGLLYTGLAEAYEAGAKTLDHLGCTAAAPVYRGRAEKARKLASLPLADWANASHSTEYGPAQTGAAAEKSR
jgi:hypothetical protein